MLFGGKHKDGQNKLHWEICTVQPRKLVEDFEIRTAAVTNISMKVAWDLLIPAPGTVLKLIGPGSNAKRTADATIAAIICK